LGIEGADSGVRKNPSTFIGDLLSDRFRSVKKESNKEGSDRSSESGLALQVDRVGGGGHIIE